MKFTATQSVKSNPRSAEVSSEEERSADLSPPSAVHKRKFIQKADLRTQDLPVAVRTPIQNYASRHPAWLPPPAIHERARIIDAVTLRSSDVLRRSKARQLAISTAHQRADELLKMTQGSSSPDRAVTAQLEATESRLQQTNLRGIASSGSGSSFRLATYSPGGRLETDLTPILNFHNVKFISFDADQRPASVYVPEGRLRLNHEGNFTYVSDPKGSACFEQDDALLRRHIFFNRLDNRETNAISTFNQAVKRFNQEWAGSRLTPEAWEANASEFLEDAFDEETSSGLLASGPNIRLDDPHDTRDLTHFEVFLQLYDTDVEGASRASLGTHMSRGCARRVSREDYLQIMHEVLRDIPPHVREPGQEVRLATKQQLALDRFDYADRLIQDLPPEPSEKDGEVDGEDR